MSEIEIKTPVRFGLSLLQDADKQNICVIRSATYGLYHKADIQDIGNQIANALNDLATAQAKIERLERILKSACIEVVEDGHQFNPKAVKHYCGEITAQRIKALEGKLAAAERLLADYTSWNPEKGVIPKIPMSHGTCCCCRDCGQYHDECVCEHNAIVTALQKENTNDK